jgi:signal transduction histidine kinase
LSDFDPIHLSLVVAITVAALLAWQLLRERAKRTALARFQVERTRARDKAREALAYGLHDEALQNLMYVRMLLSPRGEQRAGEQRQGEPCAGGPTAGDAGTLSMENVREARSVAYEVVAQIRRVIDEMMPASLGTRTLTAGVESFMRRMGSSHPHIAFELAVGNISDKAQAVADDHLRRVAFNVVAEAIRNAVEHPSPRKVRVALQVHRNVLLASVSNDGDPMGEDLLASPTGTSGSIYLSPTTPVLQDLASQGRYGLIEAVERAESVGGRVCIDSKPELTTITLAAPLRQRAPSLSRGRSRLLSNAPGRNVPQHDRLQKDAQSSLAAIRG